MVCEYTRDKPLTISVLWEIAYGIHKESLWLDSLQDFRATEADIMHMKEDILATWKARDMRKTSSLGPTFVSSTDSKSRESTLGKTFIPGVPAPSSVAPCGPSGDSGTTATSPSVFKPLVPPPGIPLAPGLSHYLQDPLPTSFPAMSPPAGYNFDLIMARPLKVTTPNILLLSSQLQDISVPTPTSP